MADDLITLTRDDVRILREMYAWMQSLRGPDVRNRPGGAFIGKPAANASVFADLNPYQIRFCQITGSTETGVDDSNSNPVQWTYDIVEIYKSGTGYGAWSTLDNGYSGTAYHGGEDGNDGSGRQMNGVNHDGADYPAGFQMYPLQTGLLPVPFILVAVPNGSDITVEAWLLPYSNGEDGTCS